MATDIVITPGTGEIEFKNSGGVVCGTISTSGNNLVLSNGVGNVSIPGFVGATPTLDEVTTQGATTTNDIGINMSNPVSALHVGDGNNTISSVLYSTDIVNVSALNTAPGFNIISAGSSEFNRGVFKATRSRGTLASPTAVSNNDYVFSLLGVAYDGTAGRATAGVEMRVDGTVSSGNAPQRIEFQTGTTTSRSTRMTIKSDGDVGINTTSPSTTLDVNGDITANNLVLAANITHEGDTDTVIQFSTDTIRMNTAGNARLTLGSTGVVTLGAYGSGTNTGTAAYTLAVDSSGNIIETTGGGGGVTEERGTFSFTTNSSRAGSFSHTLGDTPSVVMITFDTANGNVVTYSVSGVTSSTITIQTNQRNQAVTGYYIIS
jgi:trimeric autotransporter adhesin